MLALVSTASAQSVDQTLPSPSLPEVGHLGCGSPDLKSAPDPGSTSTAITFFSAGQPGNRDVYAVDADGNFTWNASLGANSTVTVQTYPGAVWTIGVEGTSQCDYAFVAQPQPGVASIWASSAVAADPTFEPARNLGCSAEGRAASKDSAETPMRVVNLGLDSRRLYWLDFNGQRFRYADLTTTGSFVDVDTFTGFAWLVTDSSDKCLGVYMPSDAGTSGGTLLAAR